MIYKLLANGGVQRLDDGAFIPASTDNIDWVAYLAWLAKGNKPLAADLPPPAPPKSISDGMLARMLIAKDVITQADVDAALAVDAVTDRP